MKKIWGKHKLAMIVFGYVLVSASALYLLAVPLVKSIKSASDKIQEKIVDQQLEQSRLGKLPQMEEHQLIFESKKDSLDVTMRPESEVGFIEEIEFIAGRTGNVISLNIGDSVDPKEIAKLKKAGKKKDGSQKSILDEITYANYFPLQINLKGSYKDLISFIHMLENSRFYVNVISINSQKETVDDRDKTSVRKDMFSKETDNDGEEGEQKIINTDINAIVYTKK